MIKTLPAYLEEVLRIAREFKTNANPKEIDGPWFRGANDHTHGLVPGAYWRTGVDETAIVVDFRDQAPPYFDGSGAGHRVPPTSLWEWYFLMQHYGLPTRLLDWTENALIGLFFALSSKGARPCVWILDPAQLNKLTVQDASVISPGGEFSKHWLPIASEDQDSGCKPSAPTTFPYKGIDYSNDKPIAIFAARRNARIIAQQGTFTVHGAESISIDKMVPTVGESPLAFIEVDPDARESLLADLELCGVSDTRLFPELEKLAPYIKRRYEITP